MRLQLLPEAKRYGKRNGETENAIIRRGAFRLSRAAEPGTERCSPVSSRPRAERLGRVRAVGVPEQLREPACVAETVLGGDPG
jgi:hypothetical protein